LTGQLVLAALLIWAVGACVDAVVGTQSRWSRITPYVAGFAGSALVLIAGVRMVLGTPETIQFGATLGVGSTVVTFDGLAGLFLTLVGGLGVVVSACLISWAAPVGRISGRGTGAGYLLLLGAVALILIAGDAFTFVFAWEALTLAFYALVGVRRRSASGARASWITLGVGKFGGACLLFGLLLLAAQSRSFSFATFATVPGGATRTAAFVLLIVAFCAKVGSVPLQVWMPIGYPEAPGPVRAAMAGLAVNVGFYGLWRFLGLLGPPPIWLAVVVLVVGGITALSGIVFAAVQSRLNRVIAYSSVENAGIILVGFGVALAGAALHQPGVEAVGLLAASLQVLAHAVAKSTIFASSGFIESSFDTDELEALRGVGRRDRWSAATFGAGAVTLAGLPPTIGFVSEWFILEALLQEFRIDSLPLRLAMAFAAALVALTVGFALLCFIRLVGLTLLGMPSRSGRGGLVEDGGIAGRSGLVVMALSCFGLAAAAPWVIRYIALGLGPVVPHDITIQALKSPWVLQPVFASFSILSPTWLYVVLPIWLVVVGATALLLSRGSLLRPRRVPPWRSATAGVTGPTRYSPFGYANALRHVLSNVLGSRRSAVLQADGHSTANPHGDTDHAHILVRTDVVEPVETYLYRPVRRIWLRLSRCARRLQSGRLEAYIAYMLAALIILLSIVAAMR
jgi:hydrogenase-4 component B